MRRPVCVIGLAFVIMITIYLYCHPFRSVFPTELDGETVILTGRVDQKEHRISKGRESLVLYLKEIEFINPQSPQYASDCSEIKGILCYLDKGREAKIGSRIRIRGKLHSFAEATNPGEFDAEGYYQILGLQARLFQAEVMEEGGGYDKFRETLWKIKRYFAGLIESCYGEEDASVVKAMLLGEKSGLDEDTKLLYQFNGVIHILSISGLHISVIGMGLYKLLCRLRCPKFLSVPFSIGFMYCYGAMAGMSVSAVRAIVMFGFHIAAGLFGRTYDMLTAMAAVGTAMLIKQPLYLGHSGFLFSFGAVLAIGLMVPAVEENHFSQAKLLKVMSTSLSISLVTFPVYLCFYYEYPLYSLFLNLVIIPGTSLVMIDSLISLAAAVFCLPLGKWLSLPSRLLLAFYKGCCTFTLKLPFSRNILGKPETWQVLVFAVLLCAACFYSRKWSRLQFWHCILLALLCITMRFQDGLEITVLDVGQGDGIYIADGSGGRYLIDGGSSDKSDVGTYQILPFLKSQAVDALDAVFVTHMDSDHYNGIYTLIEQMDKNGVSVGNLFLPDVGEGSRSEEYKKLANLAVQQGIRLHYIHRGETLCHGKLKMTCLHPEQGAEMETNAASIVLYLEYEAFTALFTGDLEGEGEESVRRQLEAKLPKDKGITMLKVAHHGSKNSTGESFLKTAYPLVALISAGRDNSYGHPHEELLLRLQKAGSRIYQTKESGAVTVIYRNGKVRVKCFLSYRNLRC